MNKKFSITVVGDDEGNILDIDTVWNPDDGLTGVNLLGLMIGECMADEKLMEEMSQRVLHKLEGNTECQNIPTGNLH